MSEAESDVKGGEEEEAAAEWSAAVDTHAPWVEKFRPQCLEHIILDKYNRCFFENVLASRQLPHLLFYGPPGAGKTTTILSIIKQFIPEVKHEVLHLNSSDLRGIDIVRDQILSFVNANSFFANAIKFVVLDEVDNMTKNAQYGLTYLLQTLPMARVRFCLICNYISKIVPSLKYEFVTIRFNQLPEKCIVRFLSAIAHKENVAMSKRSMKRLCARFGSDVRSMINYMQTQYTLNASGSAAYITDVYMFGTTLVTELSACTDADAFQESVYRISRRCNCSVKEVLREYFIGLLETGAAATSRVLAMMEHVMHNIHTNMDAANVRFVFHTISSSSIETGNLVERPAADLGKPGIWRDFADRAQARSTSTFVDGATAGSEVKSEQ